MLDMKSFDGSKSATLWRTLCNQISEESPNFDADRKVAMAFEELYGAMDQDVAATVRKELSTATEAHTRGKIIELSPMADAALRIVAMHVIENKLSRPLALPPRLVEALTDPDTFPFIVFECSTCHLMVCIPPKYADAFSAECPICGESRA